MEPNERDDNTLIVAFVARINPEALPSVRAFLKAHTHLIFQQVSSGKLYITAEPPEDYLREQFVRGMK